MFRVSIRKKWRTTISYGHLVKHPVCSFLLISFWITVKINNLIASDLFSEDGIKSCSIKNALIKTDFIIPFWSRFGWLPTTNLCSHYFKRFIFFLASQLYIVCFYSNMFSISVQAVMAMLNCWLEHKVLNWLLTVCLYFIHSIYNNGKKFTLIMVIILCNISKH